MNLNALVKVWFVTSFAFDTAIAYTSFENICWLVNIQNDMNKLMTTAHLKIDNESFDSKSV